MKDSFKFKDLKVYSDTQWLYNNSKSYRNVFDRYTLSYVYAEVSIYNKQFDGEDWEFNCKLICYRNDGSKICELPLNRTVSKHEHIAYLREGWGNKGKGEFWTRGTYYWEVWVEEKLLQTRYFYVVELADKKEYDPDAFLQLESIRFYEAPAENKEKNKRIYLRDFDQATTRYIYVEVICKNLNKSFDWHCEIMAHFFTDSQELKGRIQSVLLVEIDQDTIEVTMGWGSNVAGSWKTGIHSCELAFLDKHLGRAEFVVNDPSEVMKTRNLATYLQESPLPTNTNPLENSNSVFAFEIPVSRPTLITPLHQFILFFLDFLRLSTGKNLIFLIKPGAKGLLFIVPQRESLEMMKIPLEEYFRFVRNGSVDTLNIAIGLSDRARDVLKLRIEQQIFNLDMELKYEEALTQNGSNSSLDVAGIKEELIKRFAQAVNEQIQG